MLQHVPATLVSFIIFIDTSELNKFQVKTHTAPPDIVERQQNRKRGGGWRIEVAGLYTF